MLERILAMVESIDHNVEEILDELQDHLTDLRYTGWPDEPSTEQDNFD